MSIALLTRYGLTTGLAAPPGPFSPSDIAGLRLWLDADDASTITDTAGAVSAWTSKDANAREFTQAIGSLQPTTGANTLNSRNVIDFAGDYLLGTPDKSVWGFMHTGAKHAVFAVARFDGANSRVALLSNTGAAGSVGFGISYDDRSSASRSDVLQHIVNNALTPRAVINTSGNDFMPGGAWRIIRVTADPGNATAAQRSSMRVNAGTAVENNTQTGTPASGNATHDLAVGAAADGGAEVFTGRIAEVLVYERDMSAAEIEDVEAYLAEKWGITL